ncbi:NAD(P) transhydrogenase subunit alpha [Mangrovihabitans endophyticus]|uniref:proton-translocating NAD(P)(+) transhydrogenase n=1 Tax=Mangrovihabitans endophyticus TaxID=1751298 RepID=A0A8J3BTB9_9ACTN|nr:NAD(P) transhydrogenase subunit alpha [Mangrovihabitans endophyticus]GGK75215.1 NAD(P) transhydrogenase subunit alpha [Mangrovihabitans endophyticus]
MVSIGVLTETEPGERRVALSPDAARRLSERGQRVLVQAGAGRLSFFDDDAYAGAEVVDRARVYADSDVLLCVHPPGDLALARPEQLLIGMLGTDPGASGGRTEISLDLLPRTLSRAQAMDALTSQANVAGYKAALLAAEAFPGFFPLLMTAAGTTRPAQVLVLGAGVAGLQAIATARRLGARVTGYDVREAARADIASTGAAVLDIGTPATTSADGYARGLGADEAAAQLRGLTEAIPRYDVVITTAQVPGRPAPRLVTADALARMRPGSVVLDLAAAADGGNVAGSVPDTRSVTGNDVTVIGAGNLAATVPSAASTAYARNMLAVLTHLIPDGEIVLDTDDEITRAVLLNRADRAEARS